MPRPGQTEDKYRNLARLYKYTPHDIATMTIDQQLMMSGVNFLGDVQALKFDTWDEYLTWAAAKGFRPKGKANGR
jgi:hypothetical protein